MLVIILARLGLHELIVRNALVKRIPFLAKRSIFGVRTLGFPAQPKSSQAMSSAMMSTMLGRLSVFPSTVANKHIRAKEHIKQRICAKDYGLVLACGRGFCLANCSNMEQRLVNRGASIPLSWATARGLRKRASNSKGLLASKSIKVEAR